MSAPPRGSKRWPNGEPICVVRPENPRKVVSLGLGAVEHQSEEAMRRRQRYS